MGKSSREANGTDHCKQHRLHPSNQALLICRMIMDPKQPMHLKGSTLDSHYLTNWHRPLH